MTADEASRAGGKAAGRGTGAHPAQERMDVGAADRRAGARPPPERVDGGVADRRAGARPPPARIRELLGGSEYAKLFAAARRRLEEAGDDARSVSIDSLDSREAQALADLLGWSSVPRGTARVDLALLDRALGESAAAATLKEVLGALGGPIRDARSERQLAAAARERMWSEARARVESRPELVAWLAALRDTGALSRAANGAGRDTSRNAGRAIEGLLRDAVSVALRLPAKGQLLAVLASQCTGDPHALDPGAPLGGLALRAAAALAGWDEMPASAPARRRLWSEVGVDCDPLSAQVLVLGLRPAGVSLLSRHLRESADAGEPRRVTLRELAKAEIAVARETVVFVCENPAIVAAAADAHGARVGALVCVEGVPSTAAMELLRALASSGAAVRVRADFDWAGLRIARQVLEATKGEPWRFRARDYLESVARERRGPRLSGPPAGSPWDPTLAVAMAREGVGLSEEQLLVQLLWDLGL